MTENNKIDKLPESHITVLCRVRTALGARFTLGARTSAQATVPTAAVTPTAGIKHLLKFDNKGRDY